MDDDDKKRKRDEELDQAYDEICAVINFYGLTISEILMLSSSLAILAAQTCNMEVEDFRQEMQDVLDAYGAEYGGDDI